MNIRIAHSPDSDDAFMFYALAANKLPTAEYSFTHRLEDIETLNRKALQGEYEVTALSIHAYAYVAKQYALLSSGASMGDRYGPMVVSREAWEPGEMQGRRIAIPGTMTTAYLALKLYQPDFIPVVMPFDKIMEAVERREVEGGLLIHEGQLTYRQSGLQKVLDLGEWWHSCTGLPLPLGGNGIRRDLGPKHIRQISRLIKASIQHALEHRQEALEHALSYARGLDRREADQFVSMYVNQRTLDYGEEGRRAVRLLLEEAHTHGLIPERVEVEFADQDGV
jgi:1,4-dihydroxy-6-naphthoate synthase